MSLNRKKSSSTRKESLDVIISRDSVMDIEPEYGSEEEQENIHNDQQEMLVCQYHFLSEDFVKSLPSKRISWIHDIQQLIIQLKHDPDYQLIAFMQAILPDYTYNRFIVSAIKFTFQMTINRLFSDLSIFERQYLHTANYKAPIDTKGKRQGLHGQQESNFVPAHNKIREICQTHLYRSILQYKMLLLIQYAFGIDTNSHIPRDWYRSVEALLDAELGILAKRYRLNLIGPLSATDDIQILKILHDLKNSEFYGDKEFLRQSVELNLLWSSTLDY